MPCSVHSKVFTSFTVMRLLAHIRRQEWRTRFLCCTVITILLLLNNSHSNTHNSHRQRCHTSAATSNLHRIPLCERKKERKKVPVRCEPTGQQSVDSVWQQQKENALLFFTSPSRRLSSHVCHDKNRNRNEYTVVHNALSILLTTPYRQRKGKTQE